MSGSGAEDAAPRAAFADWKRLDLEPGADERVARIAYAKALKRTKPETDPEGFQALREAYDRVLEEIRNPPAKVGPWGEGVAEQQAAPSDGVDAAAVVEAVHRVAVHRRRGDTAGALAALDASLQGTLRLSWRHAVEDAILDDIAGDASARPELLQGLAERFDWREATGRHAAEERMGPLRERVESADYIAGLRNRVAVARAGGGAPGEAILVRIFGPYRVGLFDRALSPEERAVAEEILGAFFQHLADVDGVIDARTLAALRSALGAAPLMRSPSAEVASDTHPTSTSGSSTAATSSGASRKTGIKGWLDKARPYWLFVAAVLFFLRMAAQDHHTTTRHYAPDTQATAADAPVLPSNVNVETQPDGAKLVHLGSMSTANLGSVAALVVESAPSLSHQVIAASTTPFKPDVVLPRGTSSFSLQLRFNDGSTSDVETFDLRKDGSGPPPDNAAKADAPGGTAQ